MRETAVQDGVTCFKTGIPGYYEWIDTHARIDAAMPNFLVQEVCSGVQPGLNEKVWEEWLGFPAQRMVDGRFPLPDKPGLGFDLSEDAFKRYPFGGTVLMGRVFAMDGSVAEW